MRFDWQRLFCGPWAQCAKTDWEWDDILNKAIDLHGVSHSDSHTAKIGPFTVWIANWPYGYGSQYAPRENEYLPSVATRHKLRKALSDHDKRVLEAFQTDA